MSAANDAHLLALLRLVREHPEPAKAAMQRLTQRVADLVAKDVEEKREAAKRMPLMFELARECVLDPTLLEVGTEVFVEGQPGFDPHLVHPGRAIPRWMIRMRDLGLAVKWEAGRDLGTAVDMIRRARDQGIDITKHTGAECYVAFQLGFESEVWSEQDIRAAVDPAFVRPNSMPLSVHLNAQLKVELRAPGDVSRTAAQWWEVGVLLLLFTHADFDGASVGLDPAIPWESISGDPHCGFARRIYGSEIREPPEAFDRLLARTVLFLGELAKAPAADGKAPKPPKNRAGGTARKGEISMRDAKQKYEIKDGTLSDWCGKAAFGLRPRVDEFSGVKFILEDPLREVLRKKKRLKD